MTEIKKREQQLKARLLELDGRLHRIEAHLEQTPDPNFEERAVESEMDEVLEGLGHSGAAEIKAIQAALVRISGGTYGVCTRCGTEISEERLDIIPQTPLCRTCAREVAE
jgi:RNA polymerase-binding transcription factor DksA